MDERLKNSDIGDLRLRNKSTWPPYGTGSDPVAACYGVLREKLTCPCLHELIWSYWNEEGMLVQTINAITRRFQNMRGSAAERSARQSRGRSAAAAEQLDLEVGMMRDAAAGERSPPRLGVRSPIWAAAGRRGGHQCAHGG